MSFRLGNAGWYRVTKSSIFFCAVLFFCASDIFLSENLISERCFCSYCACASSYNAIVLMDRVDFTEVLSETFGSRSIFLAHDI